MKSTFHAGELAAQARAGVEIQAQRVSGVYHDRLPEMAIEFLQQQQFAVASSVDRQGEIWASPLMGPKNFLHAVNERLIAIDSPDAENDPLWQNLATNAEVGLLIIDFATRRRMKVKGPCERNSAGQWLVHVERVYSLCHKYIQARQLVSLEPRLRAQQPDRSRFLGARQRTLIGKADTCFIASFHPETGADAAHRGGAPGFIRVTDEGRLVIPDYQGNNLLNTLGNVMSNPKAGLLFWDFDNDTILQLSGRAEIIWESAQLTDFPGAKRLIQFEALEVIERVAGHHATWQYLSPSPFNPSQHKTTVEGD